MCAAFVRADVHVEYVNTELTATEELQYFLNGYSINLYGSNAWNYAIGCWGGGQDMLFVSIQIQFIESDKMWLVV